MKKVLIVVALLVLAGGGFFAKKQMDASAQKKAESELTKATADLKSNLDNEYGRSLGADDLAEIYQVAYKVHNVQTHKLLEAQEEARRNGHRTTDDLKFQTNEITTLLAKQQQEWEDAPKYK